MITHLRDHVCIKMTTLEKDAYKRKGHHLKPWDTTVNVTTYFKYLEDFRISLAARRIANSYDNMIMACVARMFESKYFTKEKLIEWENKPDADKTWDLVKTYFTALYNDRMQFSKAMAGQSVFHQ